MYILAIDQGTSSTKTLIFDAQGQAVAKGAEPLKTMYLKELNTDGGITSNTFIMQFLTDLLGITTSKIGTTDVSALGAAYLAGLG